MSASDPFLRAEDFAAHLRSLREKRSDQKLALRNQVVRKPLARSEREQIFQKTGGRCHICGGVIEGAWEADHVFSHSLGRLIPSATITDGFTARRSFSGY